MFMSVVAPVPGVSIYPELAGGRVLITGFSSITGVDLARAFADHKARLVLQTCDETPAMTELSSLLARSASETTIFNDPIDSSEKAMRFAQSAFQCYGGLDSIINLISITSAEIAGYTSEADVEDLISSKLLAATLITRIAGNRMGLTWTEGSVLNALLMRAPRTTHEAAFSGFARAALGAITRREAQAWSDKAVRINAIAPRAAPAGGSAGAYLSTGPEIASLALHLASRKGRALSGHVFDAELVAASPC
jgi:3-oxoacyl-[acyl-carrier protein] reductase